MWDKKKDKEQGSDPQTKLRIFNANFEGHSPPPVALGRVDENII